MNTPFDKTFDELLNDLLTDYQNQLDSDGNPIDTSKGSLAFIKSACIASALWGLYKAQGYIGDQIFPDSSDSGNLEHHVSVRGIPPRKVGETDADLLARLFAYIRRPPAGGNKYDYIKWSLEVANVKNAYPVPLGQGLGTVDLVIIADAVATGSEIPSSHAKAGTATAVMAGKLVDAAANFTDATPVRMGDIVRNAATGMSATITGVDSATQLTLSADIFMVVGNAYAIDSLTVQVRAHIVDICPLDYKYVRVLAPTILTEDVAIAMTGSGANKAQVVSDIIAYLNSFIPGQVLNRGQLVNIGIANGADDATVTTPAANVVPTAYQMIRPGVISAP